MWFSQLITKTKAPQKNLRLVSQLSWLIGLAQHGSARSLELLNEPVKSWFQLIFLMSCS
jgi:hypothetical protein